MCIYVSEVNSEIEVKRKVLSVAFEQANVILEAFTNTGYCVHNLGGLIYRHYRPQWFLLVASQGSMVSKISEKYKNTKRSLLGYRGSTEDRPSPCGLLKIGIGIIDTKIPLFHFL
ncbi:hypothetical protein PHYBLDRAFT_171765 [Phycomyces blakesleeanus NRRL 1555(-)]|uniref:Uncharacterized protein n=1 Tax=Phycomyces blakesleeanus (strain ATCC 8743b / DSM 1359 / FGSC 10004 / NBRC 33097 / NRRL 1555) TaxID=763407 RepID=A0A167LG84_PHYB8|nr:hypothetical protein PHYBLDRAFT_171765 [Phycomyces blakesleeanus NRRL 1555(-)]OAD70387.1 hypothetical protein PHYBLDRAFT_171765 [Phycomyces blakesleeanus NRRL 1555(-)]|eukprot:XP_018288427.1 hypothetical protein PHYBLDRAFT_171765 [Phycomyces blakesleeanus NRRL 1555(-)]